MLTDIPVQDFTPEALAFAAENGIDPSRFLPRREREGVYAGGLNCEHYFEKGHLVKDGPYPEWNDDTPWEERLRMFRDYHGEYGVADTIEQVLEHHADLVNHPEKKYVVVVTPIFRHDQPERDGWRWHKWGEYIGRHEITHEYLYDQPEIDHVLVYHLYAVRA